MGAIQTKISRLEIVPVREAFAHEAYDFTAWLEEHIDVLSQRLELRLAVTGREKRVGDFIIDLVCEDEAGRQVVIENQLERTNHSHLGQLLTYMIGVDAKQAIWIATESRPEHQKVIEWLNESSPDDIGFYLVKVEAARIGNSDLAPLFTILAAPDKQSKELGEEKKTWAARHQVRNDFWTLLLERARVKTKLFNNISPSRSNWIGTSAGVSGLKYTFVVTNDWGAVELYIDSDKESGAKNKELFDSLYSNRDEIESNFGGPLDWERLDAKRASRIRKSFNDLGLSNSDQWDNLQTQMIEAMIRLEKAVKPFIK